MVNTSTTVDCEPCGWTIVKILYNRSIFSQRPPHWFFSEMISDWFWVHKVELPLKAAQHCYSVTGWFGVTLGVNSVSFNPHITSHINGRAGLVHEATNCKLFPFNWALWLPFFDSCNDENHRYCRWLWTVWLDYSKSLSEIAMYRWNS